MNTGVKYESISASSSSVNMGNIAYGGQANYIQENVHMKGEHREKREYRDDLQHDLMATMMQHQGMLTIETLRIFVSAFPPGL